MKRVIILVITALTTVSCILDDGQNNNGRTGQNLMMFSEDILGNFVEKPANDLVYLLVLDEFLQLTEEERGSADWASFKSGIEFTKETTLRISSRQFLVNTGGVSLRIPGNHWEIVSYGNYIHSWNSGNYYNWVGPDSDASDEYTIRISCTATDKYEITDGKKGKEAMYLALEAIPSSKGGYDFSCSGSGRMAENKKGLSAEYELAEFYYERQRITEDGTGHSSVTVSYSAESIDFKVDTYHNGQALDWCHFKKNDGGVMEIGSNLEYRTYYYQYE